MIKAILFDFDGTISNRFDNAYYIFKDYFRPFFNTLDDIEYESLLQDLFYYDMNGTVNVELRMEPFKKKYKVDDEFIKVFKDYYYKHMFEYTVLQDDTLDTLKALKGKYKLAILSNGDSASQHAKIDHLNIEDYFDEIIVTGDYGIHKPSKEIFDIAANKLNVKNEECLFIGDVFSTDILGATRANMKPVWIVKDNRPAYFYTGYRIKNLIEILDIVEKENS